MMRALPMKKKKKTNSSRNLNLHSSKITENSQSYKEQNKIMSTHIQWTVIGNNSYYYLNLTQNAEVMNYQDIKNTTHNAELEE